MAPEADQGKQTMTTHEETITEITTPLDFETALSRVTDAIAASGLTIFARVDHAANAQGVGLSMPPTVVIIYGNAKGGTPIMCVAPRAALDLPLRVLVREVPSGCAVAFHPMAPLLRKAGVPDELAHKLDLAQNILEKALQP